MLGRSDKDNDESGTAAGRRTSGKLRSVIGADLQVEGSLERADSIQVDGTVTGDIHATAEVIVGDGGRVDGDITAPRIVVGGAVSGELEADDELVLRETAELTGDARAPVVVIESGASMRGNLRTGSFFDAT